MAKRKKKVETRYFYECIKTSGIRVAGVPFPCHQANDGEREPTTLSLATPMPESVIYGLPHKPGRGAGTGRRPPKFTYLGEHPGDWDAGATRLSSVDAPKGAG